jgi:hypothetical protein
MSADTLAGALWLFPGQPLSHSLRSTRRPLASRAATGQRAAVVPDLLAHLFNLCGHAHRLCSRLAIDAAAPGLLPAPAATPAAVLRRETATEHVRRIGLDWPRLLACSDAAQADTEEEAQRGLRACPLLRTPAGTPLDWDAVHDWLQTHWLGMAPATWLRAWQACDKDWLNDWSRRGKGWLPALLRRAKANDVALPLDDMPPLAACPDALRELGGALDEQGDPFSAAPRWRGHCAHTGAWSRRGDTPAIRPGSAWTLLGSRIAELAHLCLPGGDGWLQWGALPTGERRGLAWVEMARGLLVYQVGLDPHDPTRVAACQALAPTEWNFHPEGVAAQALSALPARATDTPAKATLLMAALDPCVPFRLEQTGV